MINLFYLALSMCAVSPNF